MPNLLRHDPWNRDYLDHDLDDDVRHSRRRDDINEFVYFHRGKNELYAVKQVYKSMDSAKILDGLRGIFETKARMWD